MTLVCHHVPDADRYLHMVGTRVDGKLTFRQRQMRRAAKLKLKAEGKDKKVKYPFDTRVELTETHLMWQVRNRERGSERAGDCCF